MARGRLPAYDWSWGEITPEAYGRLDLDPQYSKSARTLRNFRPLEVGAATRRAGTRFIAEVKDATNPPSLVTFIAGQGEAYLLEAGEHYLRFYRNRARLDASPGVPLELATPWPVASCPLLKTAQSFDVLYVASTVAMPQRLERYGDLIWKLRPTHALVSGTYGGQSPPSYEYGARPIPGATLTPAATTGSGIVVTAGAAGMFREADVGSIDNPGREIVVLAGASTGARARVVGFTDTQHVTVDISEPFASTAAIAATDWKLTGSPLTILTPGAAGPVGLHTTLTLTDNGWRLNDAVKFVRINNGLIELNDFDGPLDPKVVKGTIRVKLDSATAAQAGAWALEEPSWSAANGYPAAVALGKGRSWYGGTPAQPISVWGSVSGAFGDFAAGVLDDDSIDEMLAGGQLNAIAWLAMTDDLYAGTRGEVYRIKSGSTDVLSPTSVEATPAVSYGCRPEAAPLAIAPALIFPTLAGLKLREMVYDTLLNRQLAPDLLLLASHLTRPRKGRLGTTARGLRRIAYQREPIATLWGAHDSGEWSCCTYLREQNVIAWVPCETQGDVLDVAVAPREDGTGDEVWLLVRRVINGTTKVFLEWMDDVGLVYDRLHVDCAVTVDGIGRSVLSPDSAFVLVPGASGDLLATSAAFSAGDVARQIWQVGSGGGQALITAVPNATRVTVTIIEPFSAASPIAAGAWGIADDRTTGLGHLEGATVVLSLDGRDGGTTVVAGAQVLHPFAVAREVGLGYTSTMIPAKRSQPPGTQGQPLGTFEVLVRLHESIGVTVNGRRPDRDYDGALFSGDKKWSAPGGTDPVVIVQSQPLPATILYVQQGAEVSGG